MLHTWMSLARPHCPHVDILHVEFYMSPYSVDRNVLHVDTFNIHEFTRSRIMIHVDFYKYRALHVDSVSVDSV